MQIMFDALLGYFDIKHTIFWLVLKHHSIHQPVCNLFWVVVFKGLNQKPCFIKTYWAYWDELVRMIHHGNEQIEQNYDVDYRKRTKHQKAEKSCKLFQPCQFKIV